MNRFPAHKRFEFIHRVTSWANSPCDSSGWRKKIHTATRILLITFKEFTGNELTLRASALTYTILLSLVPILALSAAVVKGLGGNDQLRTVVYSYIETLDKTTPITTGTFTSLSGLDKEEKSPEQGEHSKTVLNQFHTLAEKVFDYVDHTNFATLGSFSILGVILSAILVFSNIEMSMNAIWHVQHGRSPIRKVTDYLTMLVLMPVSINLGFITNTMMKNDKILTGIMSVFPAPWVQTGLLLFAPLFFITLTLFLIYLFFPNTKVQTGPAFIGALCAAILWFITQNFYIGLQIGVSKYNAIYGSFATIPLFLIWMFLGWVFILGGAQLAFACQRVNSYQLIKFGHSAMEQLSAALDIILAINLSHRNRSDLRIQDLNSSCPAYSALLLKETAGRLIDGKLVEINKYGRLLPAAPPDRQYYKEIVHTILGSSFPATTGGRAGSDLLKQMGLQNDKTISSFLHSQDKKTLHTHEK